MPTPTNSDPLQIDCHAVKARLDAHADQLLLDCRERAEYAVAHIEGARLLPMSGLAQRVSELNKYRTSEVVVYCHHGVRSLRVASWLRQQGFSCVRSMTGGIDAWSLTIDPAVPRY